MPSNPPHESTPRTFTGFSSLPPELRCKICRYALPAPRVIHITERYIILKGETSHSFCFAENVEHPVLLQVSHESRSLALKHYRCTFEPYLGVPIYFDPSQDVLLMQNKHVLDSFFEISKSSITCDVTLVEVIAVDPVHLGHHVRPKPIPPDIIGRYPSVMAMANGLKDAVARFGNLRQIILLRPHLTNPAQDVQESICSDEFQENLKIHYSESKDRYALKRKNFLRMKMGIFPISRSAQ